MEFFRPPSIPLLQGDPYMQVYMNGDTSTSDTSRFWTGKKHEMFGMVKIDDMVYRWLGDCDDGDSCPPALETRERVRVDPTRTVFTLGVPNNNDVEVTVTFLSPLFTDDLALLSRPIHYVSVDVSGDNDSSTNSCFLSLSGQFAVNSEDEPVIWKQTDGASPVVSIGTETQDVLGFDGDKVNLNWGYLYLSSTSSSSSSYWAGNLRTAKGDFISTGGCKRDGETWTSL